MLARLSEEERTAQCLPADQIKPSINYKQLDDSSFASRNTLDLDEDMPSPISVQIENVNVRESQPSSVYRQLKFRRMKGLINNRLRE